MRQTRLKMVYTSRFVRVRKREAFTIIAQRAIGNDKGEGEKKNEEGGATLAHTKMLAYLRKRSGPFYPFEKKRWRPSCAPEGGAT